MNRKAGEKGCLKYSKEQGTQTGGIETANSGVKTISLKNVIAPKFSIQKLNYIHNNPVETGIVVKPEEYLYSSARDYYRQINCGLLKIDFI